MREAIRPDDNEPSSESLSAMRMRKFRDGDAAAAAM
jgi:hypothetical protein